MMFGTLRCVVVILLFVLLRNGVSALRREFPTCRSSDTCIRLTECVPYMNLIKSLRKPLTRSAVVFLRRQECGFDGLYPMVCCFPSNPRWALGNGHNSMNEQRFTTKPPTHTPSYYNVQRKPDQTYRLPAKPDFNPSDLSDYRSYKAKTPTFSSMNPTMFKVPMKESRTETTTIKSTTEKVKTSTWFYNKNTKNMFNRKEDLGREDEDNSDVFGDDYVDRAATTQSILFLQNEEIFDEKAEEMKKKMEELNHAFMFSSMDYFFVRRMGDQDKTNNLR